MPRNRVFSTGVRLLAVVFVLFHLYTGLVGALLPLYQRPIHVMFALVLTFVLVSAGRSERSRGIPLVDWVLIGIIVISVGYIVANTQRLMISSLSVGVWEAVFGGLLAIVAVEAARRRIGWTFPILVIIAGLYTALGHLIPGRWGHPPISLVYMAENLYLSDVGLWGAVTGVSSTLVALFIIFGDFMTFTGGGQTFIDLAVKFSGRLVGGGAKVATVGSALFGTISGSGIANTAAIGNFTIPLMKKLGYSAEYAAAVEATAATGGIFTPPVMGSTAFVLASFVGVPYLRVCTAAIIPAFLFYLGVYFSIDAYARKMKLPGVPSDMVLPWPSILALPKLVPLAIPIGVLIGLLIVGYSAFYTAFWACITALVLFNISVTSLAGIKSRLKRTVDGLELAGKGLASIVPLLVSASIVVALIQLTGIGIKLSELIFNVGQGNLVAALFLGAIVDLVLGCGLPGVAAYILCAAIVVPGLTKLGLNPLAAHMFVMYFACLSNITPPVCPDVFVASAIAKSDWLKTAFRACRLALIIFVIPFIFVYNTSLIMEGPATGILVSLVGATWATFLISIGLEGFFLARMGVLLRIVFCVSGILLIVPRFQFAIVGAVLSVLAILIQIQLWRGSRQMASSR